MLRQLSTLGLLVLVPLCAARAQSLTEEPARPPVDAPLVRLGELDWHTNYSAAYAQAQEEKKQLFIYFFDPRQSNVTNDYRRNVLARPELKPALDKVVRALVSLETPGPQRKKGKKHGNCLVDHPAFRHLGHRAGLVVIDLTDAQNLLQYGQVVSAHAFTPGLHYTLGATWIVLDLPRGTITQRALVFALRMHPEAPRSVHGAASKLLFQQAKASSELMAQYGSVGHHGWGNRAAVVSNLTGRSPSEVAASSYGATEDVLAAAKECVAMWRTSSTHWMMIQAAQSIYGYDMVKAPNGQWYATGIFAP